MNLATKTGHQGRANHEELCPANALGSPRTSLFRYRRGLVPSFPQQAMLGSLGDLARELGKDNEVPEEFLFMNALTVAGLILSGRVRLASGLDSDTRLFTISVGESAGAKKSSAQRKILDFFIGLGLPNWSICNGVGSAEGLANALERAPVVLAIDELKYLLQKTQIRGSVLLPMVTALFEQISYQNEVKDSSISLSDARLSLVANCTTETFDVLWDHEALAIGLVNRLMLVSNERKEKVPWPEEPNKGRLSELSYIIKQQLTELPTKPIGITPDARVVWGEWYRALPETEFSKRLDTIGFRMMPILAITTGKDIIDLAVIKAITALLDYELVIRHDLQPIDAQNEIARTEMRIRRSTREYVGRRDIYKRVHAERVGEGIFEIALRNLIRSGKLIVEKETGKYRLSDEELTSVPTPQKPTIQ